MAQTQHSATQRPAGWYIPWLFVAFFAVMLTANGTMVYFAMTTWTGIAEEDHFNKDVKYNLNLDGARAQAERAWNTALNVQGLPGRKVDVDLQLKDHYGNLLTNGVVMAEFKRPTSEGHDFVAELTYRGDGHYGAAVEAPLPGIWDVHITAQHATGDYQKTQRVIIRE